MPYWKKDSEEKNGFLPGPVDGPEEQSRSVWPGDLSGEMGDSGVIWKSRSS